MLFLVLRTEGNLVVAAVVEVPTGGAVAAGRAGLAVWRAGVVNLGVFSGQELRLPGFLVLLLGAVRDNQRFDLRAPPSAFSTGGLDQVSDFDHQAVVLPRPGIRRIPLAPVPSRDGRLSG